MELCQRGLGFINGNSRESSEDVAGPPDGVLSGGQGLYPEDDDHSTNSERTYNTLVGLISSYMYAMFCWFLCFFYCILYVFIEKL